MVTKVTKGVIADSSIGADQLDGDAAEAIREKLHVPSTAGPNIIGNGGMEVAQRPVPTVTSDGGFFYGPVDRIAVRTGLTSSQTVSQVETADVGASGYACRITAEGSLSISDVVWRHRIEAKETRKLLRRGGYLSVDVLHDAGVAVDFSIWILKPGSADDFSSTFTVYQDVEVRPVPSDTPTTLELALDDLSGDAANGLEIQISAVIGATSGAKNFDLTSLQFRPGTEATPFVPRPYAEELVLCQRYYQTAGIGMAGQATTTTGADFGVQFPTMRADPTLLSLNATPDLRVSASTNPVAGTWNLISAQSNSAAVSFARSSGTWTANVPVVVTSEDVIGFDAEL